MNAKQEVSISRILTILLWTLALLPMINTVESKLTIFQVRLQLFLQSRDFILAVTNDQDDLTSRMLFDYEDIRRDW